MRNAESLMAVKEIVESAIEACEKLGDGAEKIELQTLLSKLKEGIDEKDAVAIEDLYKNTFAIAYSFEKQYPEIEDVSEHWRRLFGYEKDEVIGHPIEDFMVLESKRRFEEEVLEVCQSLGHVQQLPFSFLKKNGKQVDVLLSAKVQKKACGKVAKAFFLLEDITDWKQAREALKKEEVKKTVILSAIQTPLKDSLQKLTSLKQKLPEEYHPDLDSVLSSLSDENILRPYFSDPNSSFQLDNEISKWLVTEYSTFAHLSSRYVQLYPPSSNLSSDLGILNSLNFNVFNYVHKQEELIDLLINMFEHFNLIENFRINKDNLFFCLNRLKAEYCNVPYHNFLHAFDSTQMLFYLLTKGNLSELLNDLDILALLFTGIAHDLGHPGLNNNFQEMTRSQLAINYNGLSILENHHASLLFQVISHSVCDLFKNLPKQSYEELRRNIIACILATDMKHHFEILTIFSNRIKNSTVFSRENADDRLILMKLAIKCADVSNCVRPYRVAKGWAKSVMEEFFHQGDLEKAANLPISAFMDRKSTSMAKCQSAFIEFIVKPLFNNYAVVLPGIYESINNLEENSKLWQKRLDEEKE